MAKRSMKMRRRNLGVGVMMRLESRFCFSGERQKRKIVQPNPSRRSETSRSKEKRSSPLSLVYFKTNLIPHYASRSIEEVARDQGVKVLDRVSLRFLRPNEYRHLRISRKGKGHSYKPKPLEKTPPLSFEMSNVACESRCHSIPLVRPWTSSTATDVR